MASQGKKPEKDDGKNNQQSDDLRIKAGMLIIVLAILPATLIALFSKSQSKESILGLMGMSFVIVLLVLFMVIRRPDPNRKGWFHMDNPIVAITVALLVQFFGFLLALLADKLIE